MRSYLFFKARIHECHSKLGNLSTETKTLYDDYDTHRNSAILQILKNFPSLVFSLQTNFISVCIKKHVVNVKSTVLKSFSASAILIYCML